MSHALATLLVGFFRGIRSALAFYPLIFADAVNVVAGVDPSSLKFCPWAERIKITRLSFWLVAASGFVFLLNYHAFCEILPADAAKPEAHTQISSHAMIAAAMVCVTLFMFDANLIGWSYFVDGARAYISAPGLYKYGEAIALSSEMGERYILRQRYWRIAISAGISFVVSIFVLMDIYSSAMTDLYNKYLLHHEQEYISKRNQIVADYMAEISKAKADFDNSRASEETAAFAISDVSKTSTQRVEESDDVKALKVAISNLEADIVAKRNEMSDLNKTWTNEVLGKNSSGKLGQGPVSSALKSQLDDIRKNITQAESEKTTKITQLNQMVETKKRIDTDVSLQDYGKFSANLNLIYADKKSARENAEKHLEQLNQAKDDEIAKRIGLLDKSPDGVSGVQDFYKRWFLLLALFVQGDTIASQIGTCVGMLIFSLAVIIFIMLIEMLPVLAKMFFSHETQYGLQLYVDYENARSQRILDMHAGIRRNTRSVKEPEERAELDEAAKLGKYARKINELDENVIQLDQKAT